MMDVEMQSTAWRMRSDGADWAAVGRELGCAPQVAAAMARQHEKTTDEAAAKDQLSLFEA
ncbi:hypothetical protein [Rhodococcus sp. Q]|uniref:hypothetical protein n=1 Tax=Rhodococcus sp. Q TaxID=2502252 RepID=UPI0010F8FCF1|nr:hypothetical protein [Rhodococcus sp. Q]